MDNTEIQELNLTFSCKLSKIHPSIIINKIKKNIPFVFIQRKNIYQARDFN